MPAEKAALLADTEDVRIRAAWYVAGSDKFATLAILGTFVLGMLGGLMGAIFDVEAREVVVTFAVAEVMLLASIGRYIRLRARTIARDDAVSVDLI